MASCSSSVSTFPMAIVALVQNCKYLRVFGDRISYDQKYDIYAVLKSILHHLGMATSLLTSIAVMH